jgi:hypothetical protein
LVETLQETPLVDIEPFIDIRRRLTSELGTAIDDVELQAALDGDLARAEPKLLRFRMLHVAARLTHSARRRRLRIPTGLPWAAKIVDAFQRIMIIAAPI